jgi:hypothetical protein
MLLAALVGIPNEVFQGWKLNRAMVALQCSVLVASEFFSRLTNDLPQALTSSKAVLPFIEQCGT